MKTYTLNNGIKTIIKRNNNTPRTAIVIYAKLNNDENKAGLYYLMTQLLFQGTTNRSSEQLSNDLDENAIDMSIEKKSDYVRFKLQFLNEDIETALEILEDILENSTFDEYLKEIEKIKGEFTADLDSAKIQAQDNYYRTIFKNHTYGIGRQEIIDGLASVTKEDIIKVYNEIRNTAQKNIAVIGDIDEDEVFGLLNKYLKNLKISDMPDNRKTPEPILSETIVTIEKEDANQAQIFKGWQVPTIFSEDYHNIILLNTILGSSGLSSRLFLELREKQGLAYTVRSAFEPYMLCGNFMVYIGTEPKNIKTSLNGFETEMNKIMNEIISDEELASAKNSAIGRRQFYQETNLLEASLKGYYEFLGLGWQFEEKLINRIKNATKEDILRTAKICFSSPAAISILAPKKYLKEANL
ncbi:insulinase family protein [bacterium]|nr:insulinase family protein [bacterium]